MHESEVELRLSSLEGSMLELCTMFQSWMANGPGSEKPLKIEDASEFLGIPVNTIYSLTSRREIPFCKRGKHLFFFKSELTEWAKTGRKRTVAEIQTQARKGVSHG